MALPAAVFGTVAEPFMAGNENVCDPQERPGVHMFADFVLDHQGGRRGRTVAPCGRHSGHSSGRAWDWAISADVPDERARAEELIEWLLANDAEIFRRAGLSYLIWDRKIWGSVSRAWKPYDGYDEQGNCTKSPCRHAHRDHVHFSFNVPGAEGSTSFYNWLSGGMPKAAPPLPLARVGPELGPVLAAFSVGFMVTVFLRQTGLANRLLGRRRWS